MDITALLSQSVTKTANPGQPLTSADGEAFAGSLQAAAARLLQASGHDGEPSDTALTLIDAEGDPLVTGEASDALRNALEALAGSQRAPNRGDGALEARHEPLAPETTEGAPETGAGNPVVGGLALAAPLSATTGGQNPARDLPGVRVPDTLNKAAAVSGWPADGGGDAATPAPAVSGDSKAAPPAWTASAPEFSAALDKSRLETRLAANQDGAAPSLGVGGATGATSGAGTPAGAATTHSAPFTLQAPVASAPWQQQLGQQMVGLAQRGDQHMELHLNPRELGPLSVSLKLDDQGAQAHFFSSHATVRGAVEQAIPQLREALAEQGIALGEAMVGEQRQNFAGNGDGQPGERGGARPGDALAGDSGEAAGETVTVSQVIGEAGGVDLYA